MRISYYHRENFSHDMKNKILTNICIEHGFTFTDILFGPQTKVNVENYTTHLDYALLLECRSLYGLNFIYVHDDAPSHTSTACRYF